MSGNRGNTSVNCKRRNENTMRGFARPVAKDTRKVS